MAASTVAYTDTTGNKDYLGMIAGQIGRRLKEASDMASSERAYAEGKAEEGGTSLSEAGIGKGYFFKRALGSRFGGDRIARTKGRMGMGGAGTDPAGNFRSRFRGGFDYNVTNELSSIPLSNALTAGLRGVESGLIDISQSLNSLARGMNDLARAQGDAAKQAILNGAFMQAFLNHMQREGARQRARSEEAGLERRGFTGGGSRGRLGSRGMVNVTPSGGSGGSNIGSALGSFGTSQLLGKNTVTRKAVSKGATTAKSLVTGGKLAKTGATKKGMQTAAKMITGSTIPQSSLAAIDDLIPGVGGTTSIAKIFSGDDVSRATTLAASTDEFIADGLGKASKSMSPKAMDLLDELMYGAPGSVKIKPDDAAELFAVLSKEGFNGPMSTDEVLDLMKVSMGEKEYAKLMNGAFKGADKPIAKQLAGTAAEKATKAAAKSAGKTAAKTTGKGIGKSIAKKIPLIGALVGIGFGIDRALKGDLLGAGLEITSGMLGMVPGLGTSLGFGIDGFLLARDLGMMPMANGGFLTKSTLVNAGEAGMEGFFPLEGARGKKTFKMFGEGNLRARMDNESDDSKLLALGHKRYYEQMGGWKSFGTGLLDAFADMKDKVGDTLSNVNPFSAENLSKVNNSSAANSIRDVIGSEVGDGYLGPKWLGIKNPFADEQANMLNNTSADTSLGQMMMSTTVINNNYAVANSGNGGEGSSDSSFPSTFTAFTVPYSLASK